MASLRTVHRLQTRPLTHVGGSLSSRTTNTARSRKRLLHDYLDLQSGEYPLRWFTHLSSRTKIPEAPQERNIPKQNKIPMRRRIRRQIRPTSLSLAYIRLRLSRQTTFQQDKIRRSIQIRSIGEIMAIWLLHNQRHYLRIRGLRRPVLHEKNKRRNGSRSLLTYRRKNRRTIRRNSRIYELLQRHRPRLVQKIQRRLLPI